MQPKVVEAPIKGVLIALVLMLTGLAIYFTGQSMNKTISWIPSLLLLIGVIVSGYYYAKQLQGNVTFGNIFAHGFKTAAAATAIYLVYTFLFVKFIAPDLVDIVIEEARKNMDKQGNLTPAQMNAALDMTRKFFVPFTIGGALIGLLLVGLIGAVIGAAISKKNPNPTPFDSIA